MTGGITVVLGDIGRNFAAGMSGGIAYLYSNDGKFDEKKFNLEMVELENLQVKDLETVKELVENHVEHTKSPKGTDILKNWKKLSENFIKVMPTDYKRALEMMAKKEIEKSV
jgi:glutamate synthase (ferredoxin)